MLFQHGVGSAPDDHVGHAKQACNQPPAGADHVYQAAIAVLIGRTRGRRREYPLIFTENCNYGSTFRRNMLGLRPWGKLLAAVGILALAAIAARLTRQVSVPLALAGVVLAVSAAATVIWWAGRHACLGPARRLRLRRAAT